MTAANLASWIVLADMGQPVNVTTVMAMLAALDRDGLRSLLTDAGVEGIRPGQSKRNMLQRVNNRLTARERSEIRNSV